MSESLRIFSTLFKRLMLLNLRNSAALFSCMLFFFVTIITFHIAIGPDRLADEIASGIIFCSLCFTLTFSADRILADDFKSGVAQELISAGVNEYLLLAAHFMAHALIYIIASLILLPLGHIIFGQSLAQLPYHLMSALLCILNVSLLLLLLQIMLHSLKASPLLVILLAPFLIPILIITVLSTSNPSFCLLLLGIFLFMLPLTMFFSKLLLIEYV